MWPLTFILVAMYVFHMEFIPETNGAAATDTRGSKTSVKQRSRHNNGDVYYNYTFLQDRSRTREPNFEEKQSFYVTSESQNRKQLYSDSGSIKRGLENKSTSGLNADTQPIPAQGMRKHRVSVTTARSSATHKPELEEAEEIFYKRSRNRVALKSRWAPHQKKNQLSSRGSGLKRKTYFKKGRTPKRQNVQGFSLALPEGISNVAPFIRGRGIKGITNGGTGGVAVSTKAVEGDMDNYSSEVAGKSVHIGSKSDALKYKFPAAIHRYLPVEHRYLSKPITFNGMVRNVPFFRAGERMQGNFRFPFGVNPMLIRRPWSGGPHFRSAPGQHFVVVNRPVKTPVPMPIPVPSPPHLIYVNRPVSVPIRRIPYPIMVPVPQAPENIVVVHHHPNDNSSNYNDFYLRFEQYVI